MRFFVGLHQPGDARHFAQCCLSVHRLRRRRSLVIQEWLMDSGAFMTLRLHGRYPEPVEHYAAEIQRWRHAGSLLAAVSQDYMCEPVILQRTGLTIAEHQHLTIARYDALCACSPDVTIMPVLQGYAIHDYLAHLRAYGARLTPGMWVGVGSLCKRNTSVTIIEAILHAIHDLRPDLRLHGFGLKTTALHSARVYDLLFSADSMAWSFAARYEGRNANDWREAHKFASRIAAQPRQLSLW